MKNINRKPLDKATGERIISYLKSVPQWAPTEAPEEIYDVGLVRREESILVMISGSSDNPMMAHNLRNIIVGMDVLALETRPRVDKNEPSGNAYHYVIQQTNHHDYPYILYGPYNEGTIVPHWFDEEDLNNYWNSK
jgi:hypothetical protein